jgi:hypothetical protein
MHMVDLFDERHPRRTVSSLAATAVPFCLDIAHPPREITVSCVGCGRRVVQSSSLRRHDRQYLP